VTAASISWGADIRAEKGVLERSLTLEVDGRVVPAVLWTPADHAGGPRPLVVLGHGRTLDKRIVYLLVLARRLARHHGIASVSLDWPGHGDRSDDLVELANAARADIYTDPEVIGGIIDHAAADVGALVTAVQSDPESGVGAGRLGYFGLSLGTMFGLPAIAADDRYDAAVLGLMGLTGGWSDRLEKDAATLTLPVLFLQQWDDELIGRGPASKLFDRIGSTDKRLHANPGAHAAVPPEELEAAEAFLASRLLL
jgi:pimeloyl-ACP methyl ester carboxylesterase